MCECVFNYSLSRENVIDENGNVFFTYNVSNNLVFTSDILTDNSMFNCSDLLSLQYSGSDDSINSIMQSDFEG